MRKTLAIVLCSFMLACSTLLCACGGKNDRGKLNDYEKQGYTAVCKLEYCEKLESTSSSTFTTIRELYSYYTFEIENKQTLTHEEYLELDEKYKHIYVNNSETNYGFNFEMEKAQNDYYNFLTDLRVGDLVKYNSDQYHTAKIKSKKEVYVYVKILNNNLLDIIDLYNQRHFLILTDSFKITYLN